MVAGDVVAIHSFPAEGRLEAVKDFKIDERKLRSVGVVDSLLIMGQSGRWSLYSLDGSRKYGECLKSGDNGLKYMPWIGSALFAVENDSLVAYIDNVTERCVLRLNLSEFVAGGENYLENAYTITDAPGWIWDIIPISSDRAALLLHDDKAKCFRRFIYDANEGKTRPLALSPSSDPVWEKEEDDKIFTRMTRYEPTRDRFVEFMYWLNQINMYSPDGEVAKTICVGQDIPDNISEIENRPRADIREAYISGSVWPVGFGAAYNGLSYSDEKNRDNLSTELQFFDWDARPVYKTEIPFYVSGFDIDFDRRILYAIDKKNDRLRAFDATPIIEAYNTNR